MFSLLLLLAIFFHFNPSICQFRTNENRWRIKDLHIWRFPKSDLNLDGRPKIAAEFQLIRTHDEACTGLPLVQAVETGEYACGWLPVGQPVKCNNFERGNLDLGVEIGQFHTCSTYLHAAEGEESVTEQVRNSLRWRVYDLMEGPEEPPNIMNTSLSPFQSIKMEIIHGIMKTQDMTDDTAQIQTYQAQFTLTDKQLHCSWLDSSGYNCQPTIQQVNTSLDLPKLSCAVSLIPKCTMLIDVVGKNTTVGEFKAKYQSKS